MSFEETVWGRVVATSGACHGVALRFRGRDFSYDYLKDKVEAYASRLYRLGIRKDDVVCISCPNIPAAIFAMYAINSIGAINFIVHPLTPQKALKRMLKKTKARLLLVLDQRYKDYKDIDCCQIFTLSARNELTPIEYFFYPIAFPKIGKKAKQFSFLSIPTTSENYPRNDDADKPSFYLSSGGTTGKSKIVVLNDKAINFAAGKTKWILGEQYSHFKSSGMMAFLPIFHGFGLSMGIQTPLTNQGVANLMVSYNEKEIRKLIDQRKMRYMIVIPYLARRMAEGKCFNTPNLKNLTHVFIGADKPNPRLFQSFDEKMKEGNSTCTLLQGYGLTETVTVVAVNRSFDNREGSVGKPLPEVNIRIEDSTGNEVERGQCGEICISSPSLALEYFDDPETTAKAFKTDKDGTRWLHTGDEGYFDEDGYLYIKGRIKDMFKIAGFNIFPSEIEEHANMIDGVLDSTAVYIDEYPHPYVNLFIKKDKEYDSKELENEIKRILSEELIKYAVPERVTFVDSFPLTPLGKTDKQALKNMSK